jgi:hypothetical protein
MYMYITLELLFIFFFLHIFHFPGQAGCLPLAPSVTINMNKNIETEMERDLGRDIEGGGAETWAQAWIWTYG